VSAPAQRADRVRSPERHVLGGQFAASQDVEDEVGHVGLELGRDLDQALDGEGPGDHVVDAGLVGQPLHDIPRSLRVCIGAQLQHEVTSLPLTGAAGAIVAQAFGYVFGSMIALTDSGRLRSPPTWAVLATRSARPRPIIVRSQRSIVVRRLPKPERNAM
jgi:hypothetical protein